MVHGSWFMVQGSGSRVQVQCPKFRVQGSNRAYTLLGMRAPSFAGEAAPLPSCEYAILATLVIHSKSRLQYLLAVTLGALLPEVGPSWTWSSHAPVGP